MSAAFALWLDDVTVSFDGFKALNHLTLLLEVGELRCIIGPNGAGKTTMMDVITGKTRPDEGRVYFGRDKVELTSLGEEAIARLGIGRKFQRPTVFDDLTVWENLELAGSAGRGVLHTLLRPLGGERRDAIEGALETVRLADRRADRAGVLAHGQKQWLELAMLLVEQPALLLVDEPVAGMTHLEIDRTAELLDGLSGAHTVVVVEHDMEFIRRIARTVTVLHEGRVLAEGSMDKLQSDAAVIEVYLGT
ncbi:MAG TPA: urea ABC transporter ATP-binding protein UrtD [Candidatus Acidoferrum sp.]|nr:urea ABC transporter ATP-binding protein UrtD [Candidatus Acidoferrum sp.]